MATRHTRSARRLPAASIHSLERLESRACMAGDVTVTVDGGTVRILGDGVANQIQVDQVTPDLVRVTGLDGTTVNGQVAAVVPLANRELRIDMKGGDDLLETDDFNGQPLIVQRLKIEMGDGEDSVEIDDLQVLGDNAVEIKLARNEASEKDILSIDNAFFQGNVSVTTGGGDDFVSIDTVEFRKDLTIQAGSGSDDVSVDDSDVTRDLQIYTSAGDDVVEVFDTDVLRDLKIHTEKGHDTVHAGRSFDYLAVSRNVDIEGGDGNDTITVAAPTSDIVIGGNLTVRGGSGDDDLAVGGGNGPVTVVGSIGVSGEAGNETVLLEGVSASGVSVEFQDGLSDLRANAVGVTGKATFKVGSGVHLVNMHGVKASEVLLEYLKGKTTANMTAVTAGALTIKTGDQADLVDLRHSAVRSFFAELGKGADVLTAYQVSSNKTEIDAGAGDDTINLANYLVFSGNGLNGDLTIRGRKGNDRMTLSVVGAASAVFDGGDGNDTLEEVNTLFGAKTVKNIEVT